jgi:hypothetical protein
MKIKPAHILIGTSTDAGRLISALDNTMTSGTNRFITLGKSDTSGNQAEIAFEYSGDDSSANALTFGFFGGERMRITRGGKVGIGTTSPNCPLNVNSSVSRDNGSFGYINVSGLTGTGSGTYDTSCYFVKRCVAQEFNAISDYRMKENIKELDLQYSIDFINNCKPVKFNYKGQTEKSHGYIAQEVLKAGFNDLISVVPSEGLEEIIEEDGFVNPKDAKFSIANNDIIPILHMAIKYLYNKIENK